MFYICSQNIMNQRSQRANAPTALPATASSGSKSAVSTSSRDRVARWRRQQQEKPEYNHELTKEQTRLRVATIRSKEKKCQHGRSCKDPLCQLHPDRTRKRKEREKIRQGRSCDYIDGRSMSGAKKRRNNSEAANSSKSMLIVRVQQLMNENRRLKRKSVGVSMTTSTPVSSETTLAGSSTTLHLTTPTTKSAVFIYGYPYSHDKTKHH